MTALQEQAVQMIRSLPDSEVSFFLEVLRRLAVNAASETYNRDTLDAMRETLDIESGKIRARRYQSVDELFAKKDAEIAGEG